MKCDGNAASPPWGRPCPREPKWEVDFGLVTPSRFCNYHKENAEYVSKFMRGSLTITRLETCPAPESTPAT